MRGGGGGGGGGGGQQGGLASLLGWGKSKSSMRLCQGKFRQATALKRNSDKRLTKPNVCR